jgi:hypothetical protein
MELESKIEQVKFLPPDILGIIENEVVKDITPLVDEDSFTKEFFETVSTDYRISEYLFLKWLDENFSFKKILYAGSGSDIIPKLVFGDRKVIHTSLEEYDNGNTNYFPDLGDGIKVITDNRQLPFKDNSFDLVLYFGLPPEIVKDQVSEFKRVLKNNGLAVGENCLLNDEDPSFLFSDFENIQVPSCYQNRGGSETQFLVFKKSQG